MNKLIEREEKLKKILGLAERIGDVDKVLEALANRIDDMEDYEDEITDLQNRMEDVEEEMEEINYNIRDIDDCVSIDDIDDYVDDAMSREMMEIEDKLDYGIIARNIGKELVAKF